jgi:alcohol dehydrogenase
MRALLLTGYGDIHKLRLDQIPTPEPAPGEVRIRVSHAGLNPVDYKIRDGALKRIRPLRFPHVMGNEVAGVVDAIGAGVTAFAIGDDVFARLDKATMGGFAEEVCARVELVARRPKTIAPEIAAGVPLVGLTAWQCLFEVGDVKRGQSVLIHGGGGSVGRVAIQLAKHAGATVTTTGGAWARELVTQLGADRFVDYREQRFDDGPERYDLVLDLVGGETLDRSFAVVRRGGVVVSIAGRPEPETARDMGGGGVLRLVFRLAAAQQLRLARQAGARYRYWFMRPDGAQLAKLATAIDAGELAVSIDRVFPIAEYADAFALQESGRARGKIILAL